MVSAEALPATAGLPHVRVSFLRLVIRALGLSFLSLLSLALALYAYVYLPQVQDLFFDVRASWAQGVIFWLWFYVIGVLFWALPLVFTARLLIEQNYQAIGVDTQSRYDAIVSTLPRIFVIAAYLIVLAGICIGAADLPQPLPGMATSGVEMDLHRYLTRHILLLFGFTALFALFLIYRGVFVRGYFRFMKGFERRRPKTFRALLIAFERLSAKQGERNLTAFSFHLEELRPPFLDRETYVSGQRGKVFMILYLLIMMAIMAGLVLLHFLSYWPPAAGLFSPMNLTGWPRWLARAFNWISDALWLQRAALLPMVLGSWLPFAAFLALLSNRLQFPIIVTLIVVGAGLTLIVSDGHDVRIVRTGGGEANSMASGGSSPFMLAQAVNLWKEKNGWAEKGCGRPEAAADAGKRSACPRPIIAVGEGGGSRAAFFLASALGHLEDLSLDQREEQKRQRALRPFDDQLFAISSVSGSSVGAAFFAGALQYQPALPPERLARALYRQRLWFRNVVYEKRGFLHGVVTYKDALQAAFSNDFLSPVLVSYLARDLTTISRLPRIMDRAGVLETSWEKSFDRVYGRRSGQSLLARPFLDFEPSRDRWSPLLLFNAASIDTGRRVIVSPLSADEQDGEGSGQRFLFTDAYDLYELFCTDRRPAGLSILDQIASFLPRKFGPVTGVPCENGRPRGLDVRLSTAAGLGARFPLVSPHANIRDGIGNVADSLVDGGYFDNSGAVTAFELAQALKRIDPALEPFAVQISSEPEWFPGRCSSRPVEQDPVQLRPALPDEPDFKPLGTLGNVLAVNATRIARSYQTMVELRDKMTGLNSKPSYELIYVCPQPRENIIGRFLRGDLKMRAMSAKEQKAKQAWKNVSLSWWLSPPLQAHLDAELYAPHNTQALKNILDLLGE
jgi:hypothetical protein